MIYIIVPNTGKRVRYSIIFYYTSDIIKIIHTPLPLPLPPPPFNPPPPTPPAPIPQSGYVATRYAPPRNTYNTTT